MATILVRDKSGAVQRHQIDKEEILIGRSQTNNDIVLSAPNVSKRHARLSLGGGGATIEDQQSTCGTFINGARVERSQRINPGDKIYIGDFVLELLKEPGLDTDVEVNANVDRAPRPAPPPPPPRRTLGGGGPPPPAPPLPVPAPASLTPPPPAAATPRPPAQGDAVLVALTSLTTAVEALYRIVMDERQKGPMSVRAAAALEETRNALQKLR